MFSILPTHILRPHCNGLRLNRPGEPPKIETKFRPSYEDSADGGRQSAYKFCTSRAWKLRRSNRNGFEVDARHSPIAPSKGEGWQLGVSGTIFSQFNLDAPSKDLINTDFRIGIPLSYKRGPFSARSITRARTSATSSSSAARPGAASI
jgi:hypothetical protein